jgi:hypothetical protein
LTGENPKLDERLTFKPSSNPGQFSMEIPGQISAEIDILASELIALVCFARRSEP